MHPHEICWRFLGRNLRDVSVALILTYRSDELYREHAWWTALADLERYPQAERVALRGLDRSELGGLLAQISEQRWSVDDLLPRTDGNPFYVEELVAAADVGGKIPSTLAEVILARVNSLTEPTRAMLHEAAVLDELMEDEWLAELSSRPLAVIVEALREAVLHHVLRRPDTGDAADLILPTPTPRRET